MSDHWDEWPVPRPPKKIRGEWALNYLHQLAFEAGACEMTIEVDLPPKKRGGLDAIDILETDFGIIHIRRVGK